MRMFDSTIYKILSEMAMLQVWFDILIQAVYVMYYGGLSINQTGYDIYGKLFD